MVSENQNKLRVLYSFPHKIGATGICYAAWQHVKHLRDAGVDMTVFPGVHHKALPSDVRVLPTLSRGKLRLPYRILGRLGSSMLHDRIVAKRLRRMAGQIDLVHCFALGSLETMRTARAMGIPTVLERCNAHTRFAYEVVELECRKLGVTMPPDHPHAFNETNLLREEEEYEAADYIFCPSDFVARTFEERGFAREKLVRFRYGHDAAGSPLPQPGGGSSKEGLTVLFAAQCAPRKGLHYALDAWLKSSAANNGKFIIVGEFIPGYAEMLGSLLSHPGISRLGYRSDLTEIMRSSDVMVLPSIEEGSALVTYDARAAGCVLLVSDSTGAVCTHGENALVHRTGDVETLSSHFNSLNNDRGLLSKLRANSLATANELTWEAAGHDMMMAYKRMIQCSGLHAEAEC
jgi:glycosyltransferase involved in cell wall biosynthesis